jgi:hypothetical protein
VLECLERLMVVHDSLRVRDLALAVRVVVGIRIGTIERVALIRDSDRRVLLTDLGLALHWEI